MSAPFVTLWEEDLEDLSINPFEKYFRNLSEKKKNWNSINAIEVYFTINSNFTINSIHSLASKLIQFSTLV